jgi:hypothetical protein
VLSKNEKKFLKKIEDGFWILKPVATWGGKDIKIIKDVKSFKKEFLD